MTDFDNLTDHDQLPDVEEYKAQVGFRSSKAGQRPDPSGTQSSQLSPFQYDGQEPMETVVFFSPPSDDADLIGLDDQGNRVGDNNSGANGGSRPAATRGILRNKKKAKTRVQFDQDRSEYDKMLEREDRTWFTWFVIAFCIIVVALCVGIPISLKKRGDSVSNAKYPWIKSSKRYNSIEKYLLEHAVSTSDDLHDSTSPQFYAAQWMAHGDVQSLSVPKSTDKEHYTFVERYALVVFYFTTGGDDWSYGLKFLTGEHVCTWYQEFEVVRDDYNLFDSDIISMGVNGCKWVDDELVPYSIFIPNNNLVGTIPNEVKVLNRIERIVLQFNDGLEGPLPDGMAQMEKLNHLALQWCGLYGNIPSWIGDLKDLTYLGLGNNHFHGAIPTEINELTALELLGLDDNDLSADIEIFSELISLKSLYLEDNEIYGTISGTLMASWPDLEEFDVSDNSLRGTLPSNVFSQNDELEVIDMHGNQFSGPIPSDIDANTKLEFLALHKNQFTGAVPESLANFRALKHLDISDNVLTGVMPDKLGEMTTLEYLFTGHNDWTAGEIPVFLVELTNMRELSLKDHRITGTIPDYIHYLSKLEFLDFHDNELTGTVPSTIGLLTNLKHLLLNSNKLYGTLPTELDQLTMLQLLLLEHNEISGSAQMVCDKIDIDFSDLEYFVTDCATTVQCPCCTSCCGTEDSTCNIGEWDANLDPIWEYGYRRFRYSYDLGFRLINFEP